MRKKDTIAVIDIGANELKLKIAESSKSKLKYIESLTYPLSLGKDTFDTGKISFEKIEKACTILKNFLIVASEYGITNIKTITTSAIREATNKDYILDQIKIKTNLDVEVIDETTEKLYIYKLMMYLMGNKYKKTSLMVYVGTGNVGISVLDDGKIPFMQNIKIGSLRLSELFTDISENSLEYWLVLEEYINTFTAHLNQFVLKQSGKFIVSGTEISEIAKLCDAREDGAFLYISKDNFIDIYEKLKYKSIDKIFADYKIPQDKTESILPFMAILSDLWKNTISNEIIVPLVFLSDAIIFENLHSEEYSKVNKEFAKSTILSARVISQHYNSNINHIQNIEKYGIKIFDKMKKIHGMKPRSKVLLQSAIILHDIGKFINQENHAKYSYDIIMASYIVGLDNLEKEIVANICRYYSGSPPDSSHESYKKFSSEDKVLISKLTAILRLADALDPSFKEKFETVDIKLEENKLVITVSSEENIDLEEWIFKKKIPFFEEVFGIKAVLKIRRAL